MNAEQFLKTIAEYNEAVRTDIPFNPNVKDGRRTEGLAVDKTNWANTIDTPPFEGYAVTCGITFTFGGLRITTDGEVLNTDDQPIRGLYAAGELVGGLFYFNYPGGSGLTSGAVFGRIAGTAGRARRQELSVASVSGFDAEPRRARPARGARTQLTATEIVRAHRGRRGDLRGGGARLPRSHRRARAGVHAWASIDPELALRAGARARPQPAARPLHGVPIGVKDIIDTADLPTEMGSPIYRGHRPTTDAACVALVRAAGAVILGKTVTCEFAGMTRAPTTNPHNVAHTPGGSSSGSGAAVADFMVPVAFGTQTGGSVLRPAAYCGVFGFKPTFGAFNRNGVYRPPKASTRSG